MFLYLIFFRATIPQNGHTGKVVRVWPSCNITQCLFRKLEQTDGQTPARGHDHALSQAETLTKKGVYWYDTWKYSQYWLGVFAVVIVSATELTGFRPKSGNIIEINGTCVHSVE